MVYRVEMKKLKPLIGRVRPFSNESGERKLSDFWRAYVAGVKRPRDALDEVNNHRKASENGRPADQIDHHRYLKSLIEPEDTCFTVWNPTA